MQKITKENLQKVKELFNCGKLTIADADFYSRQGYQIVCRNGKVDEILPPSFVGMPFENVTNDKEMAIF